MTELWEIDKTFSFCYGHRVHSQILNVDYTEQGHTCAACRHLHGHEGKVQVFLSGDKLNTQGMVEDFVNLGWVKNFLDDTLDHKFVLDVNDPWFDKIVNAKQHRIDGYFKSLISSQPLTTSDGLTLPIIPVYVPGTEYLVAHTVDVSELSGPEKEFYEGFVFVTFVPTSENLAKWLFEAIDAKMKLIGVQVSKISWNETPKSRAVYSRPE